MAGGWLAGCLAAVWWLRAAGTSAMQRIAILWAALTEFPTHILGPHPRNADIHSLLPPYSAEEPPPGHLQDIFSLASTRVGDVNVSMPGGYPSPREFACRFAPPQQVKADAQSCHDGYGAAFSSICGGSMPSAPQGKPLLLRGLARTMPAYEQWATDAALIKLAGRTVHSVEVGPQQETRRSAMQRLSLVEFLSRQAKERAHRGIVRGSSDVMHYLVSSVPRELARDLLLPPMLRCGGSTDRSMRSYIWMSTGGTSSVLHEDSDDNLHCVFAGSKKFFIVDVEHREAWRDKRCGWYDAEIASSPGRARGLSENELRLQHGYGTWVDINATSVDLVRFPCWANIPWTATTVESGDCLFLPAGFLHHVRADGGAEQRSISTNLWWRRPKTFEPTKGFGCADGADMDVSAPPVKLPWGLIAGGDDDDDDDQ